MPRTIFSTKPQLQGQHVLLRPFTAVDIEAMGPVLADPEVLRLTGSTHTSTERPPPVLDAATRAWYESRVEQDDPLDLAVVDAATDQCVGEVVLNQWDPGNRSCTFRTLVGRTGRNRGLGSEALGLLLDHAFTATDLHRIELGVYVFNPRARTSTSGPASSRRVADATGCSSTAAGWARSRWRCCVRTGWRGADPGRRRAAEGGGDHVDAPQLGQWPKVPDEVGRPSSRSPGRSAC